MQVTNRRGEGVNKFGTRSGFGWALFLSDFPDGDDGVMLKAEAEYESEAEAKAAGSDEFDSLIQGGISHPERLTMVVFDDEGNPLQSMRARRLTAWN